MSNINFEPFLTESNIKKYRIDNYQRYIKLIHIFLNAKHGTDFSLKYWELIVGPWLIHFIYLL